MDSSGNTVRLGELVTYHGSLSAQHGTWQFCGTCGSCCLWSPSDSGYMYDLPECRFVLRHPETGQLMEHVRAASFTRVPQEARPAGGTPGLA